MSRLRRCTLRYAIQFNPPVADAAQATLNLLAGDDLRVVLIGIHIRAVRFCQSLSLRPKPHSLPPPSPQHRQRVCTGGCHL